MSARLSPRARTFLREHGAHDPRTSFRLADLLVMFPDLRRDPHLVGVMDPELLALLPAVVELQRTHGGLTVPVVDGPLAGELRLGVHGSDPVWRTSDGHLVCRVVGHSTPSARCCSTRTAGSVPRGATSST